MGLGRLPVEEDIQDGEAGIPVDMAVGAEFHVQGGDVLPGGPVDQLASVNAAGIDGRVGVGADFGYTLGKIIRKRGAGALPPGKMPRAAL